MTTIHINVEDDTITEGNYSCHVNETVIDKVEDHIDHVNNNGINGTRIVVKCANDIVEDKLASYVQEPTYVADEDINKAEKKAELLRSLRVAELGSSMRRVYMQKLSSPVVMKLSIDNLNISYPGREPLKCMPRKYKSLKIREILEVREGWNTDNFHKASSKASFVAKVKETFCFSIIYRHPRVLRKSVDFVAETSEIQKAWYNALVHLVENVKKEALFFNEEKWLKEHFEAADVNNNGSLSFKEVFKLVTKLNLEISQDHAKRIYEKADYKKNIDKKVKDDGLEFDEFLVFFRILTKRKDILKIMKEHATNHNLCFSLNDVKNFIEKVQKESEMTIEFCENIISQYEPFEINKKDKILSVQGLRNFLLSKDWGTIFKPAHEKVFQNMNLPLVNYYINSSHNTYLSGHQLIGDATIEGYVNTLQRGVRFLEIDIWDGVEGPVVTHGRTLINPIRFRDVIKAVNDYGFVKSSYPVILTLENHCSIRQQIQMASIFKEVLGDKLYIPPPNCTELPSPNKLSNKVLIKGKATNLITPSVVVVDSPKDTFIVPSGVIIDTSKDKFITSSGVIVGLENDNFTTPSAAIIDTEKVKFIAPSADVIDPEKEKFITPFGVIIDSPKEEFITHITHHGVIIDPTNNKFITPSAVIVDPGKEQLIMPSAVINDTQKDNDRGKDKETEIIKDVVVPAPKIPLGQEMSHITSLPACKVFDLVEASRTNPYNGVVSIAEGAINSLVKDSFDHLVHYTSDHFVKVYPKGLRLHSSNFDPMPSWISGAQLVSLNAQTMDEAFDLNQGLFSLNGHHGYVLKPESLRNGTFNLKEAEKRDHQLTIHLTVISAQFLPKPTTALAPSDIIDPFVSVQLFGIPSDEQKKMTKVIQNNGFNPIWDQSFDFKLKAPEFALLRFVVMDYDKFSSNDFIGECTVPVISLNEGYRHICLNTGYAHLPDPTARLFVKVDLEWHNPDAKPSD